MKKINLILGALVCLFAFSACTDEVDYTPASPESANGVYFPSTSQASVALKSDANTYDVQICRTDTAAEQTVQLTVETNDTVGALQIPNTVTFAAGQSSANLTINYDFAKMGYANEFAIQISIDPAVASTVGLSSYAFTVVVPEPWKSLGMATFTDTFFFLDSYKVEVQQNELNPNYFRLVYPYHEAFEVDDDGYWGGPWENTDEYMNLYLLQPGETLGDATITQEDLVYFDPFCTGWNNPNYNDIVNIYHPVTFAKYQDEQYFTYNKVVSYQENGLPAIIQLAPYYYMDNTGGWDNTQNDGMVTIVFPGVVVKDYSVGIEYAGRFTNASDETFADFNVAMGEDVASVKVGMALTSDPNAVVAGILNGSIEAVEITEAGTVRYPMATPGEYIAVAISFDAEGNPQEAAMAEFEYVGGAGPVWNSLGMGQYTEGFVCSLFNVQPVSYVVEVQECEDKPGLYRMVNPYGEAYPYNQAGDWDTSKDYYLEINAEDPEGVYIEAQKLGFDWGYGMFSASSYAYMLMANYDLETIKAAGYCGKLQDGVITFPTQGLLVTMESEDGWYYANVAYDENDQPIPGSGSFKLVLPSAAKSSKSVKAIVNTQNINKKKVSGQRLKKFEKSLPQKFQKK
ncbi:MAG: hypothetical protein IKJ52_00540 [Muribaculaceae bacterium]|nr:hypothetical protein [Muribaculaceae bacterium]